MSTATGSKPTKAESIARQLHAEIAAGRLGPGQPLDETTIAARYGVSRTPIREAIRQLAASGVIVSRPHRGAVVPALSQGQLDDMFAVMADLEGLCARAAAVSTTAGEQERLREILRAARPLVACGDGVGYSANNDQFHAALYAGAHNGYLAALTEATRTKLLPYRRAQFGARGRLARSLAEHEGILAAVAARDPALAFERMRAHIVIVRTVVEEVVPSDG